MTKTACPCDDPVLKAADSTLIARITAVVAGQSRQEKVGE
jgi:hypothetical protein